VTRIGELGTTATNNQRTPFFIVTAVKTSNLIFPHDLQPQRLEHQNVADLSIK
jgi:hypothetical protein